MDILLWALIGSPHVAQLLVNLCGVSRSPHISLSAHGIHTTLCQYWHVPLTENIVVLCGDTYRIFFSSNWLDYGLKFSEHNLSFLVHACYVHNSVVHTSQRRPGITACAARAQEECCGIVYVCALHVLLSLFRPKKTPEGERRVGPDEGEAAPPSTPPPSILG